ncbi:MAG: polyphenol oxidase family protein [Myxococcota bacterium]|nr:polyphenol oxidase family protein [Myxococcota bacterium]
MNAALKHASLPAEHGFGVRGMQPPPDVIYPTQVHGVAVARVKAGAAFPPEADAIVTTTPGTCVGVLTADCVPILVSNEDGSCVAAIHAGWRGLAAGVVEQGIVAMRDQTQSALVTVIGPHIGACCYEVDAPVIEGLRVRFGDVTENALALVAGKPGHAMLELARLVEHELERCGLTRSRIARLEPASGTVCTQCGADRFHSYRRDGEQAGRLLHFIRASGV